MLMPKKTKFRKTQRGRMTGRSGAVVVISSELKND